MLLLSPVVIVSGSFCVSACMRYYLSTVGERDA